MALAARVEKFPPPDLDEKLDDFLDQRISPTAIPDPWWIIGEFRTRTRNDREQFTALLQQARTVIEILDFDQQLSTVAEVVEDRGQYAAIRVNRLVHDSLKLTQSGQRADAARARRELDVLIEVLADWTKSADELKQGLIDLQKLQKAIAKYRQAIGEVLGSNIADSISVRFQDDFPIIELPAPPHINASTLVDKEMEIHDMVANSDPAAVGCVAIAYRGMA